MRCREEGEDGDANVRLQGMELQRVDAVKCLGCTLSADGGEDKELGESKRAGRVGEICLECRVRGKGQ